MTAAITTKRQMYRLLSEGVLGNTLPQWFSVEQWQAEYNRYAHYDRWGVRSMSAGHDKRMRHNVSTDELPALVRDTFPGGCCNISPMIARFAVLHAEVFEQTWSAPYGLTVWHCPPIDPNLADIWRQAFRQGGKQTIGLAAHELLQSWMWDSDYADLLALLERYPDHAVEMTVCSRAVGLIPNRNTIIWEVRLY